MNIKKFLVFSLVTFLSLLIVQSVFGQINITHPEYFFDGNYDQKVLISHNSHLTLQNNKHTKTLNPDFSLSAKTKQNNSIGTIYFSNNPFSAGGSIEGAKTKFNSNEFVYGRIILNGGTVREVLKPIPLAKPYDDILIIYFAPFHSSPSVIVNWAVVKQEDLDKKYWDFELLPNPDNLTMITADNKAGLLRAGYTQYLYYYLANNVNSEGEQKLGVEIAPFKLDFRGDTISVDSENLIKAHFTYNFRGSDYQFVKSNYEKVSAASKKIDGLLRKVPDQWAEKSNPLAFGVTEATLRSMFLNIAGSNTQILKFYAYPPRSTAKWTVSTNPLGIPTVRYHNQIYMIFYRDAKDASCYAQDFRLLQRYAGGGKYSATILEPDNRTQIICSKLGVK